MMNKTASPPVFVFCSIPVSADYVWQSHNEALHVSGRWIISAVSEFQPWL